MLHASQSVLDSPRRHAISAAEYLRMGEAGVFAPGARLELIDGEIIDMTPIGSRHAGAVNALTALLVRLAGDRGVVAVQNPAVVSDRSVPQPDLVLLAPRADRYARAHPTADEIWLAIEVADTTLAFDVERKVPMYARAGVREVWVVDVNSRAIRVYRDPDPAGYRTTITATGDDIVASLALPEVRLRVAEVFPLG
jgi:Uma2 family endonuclease